MIEGHITYIKFYWWNWCTILNTLILCVLLSTASAADPNYLDADGNLDVTALMAYLNDPNNFDLPEPNEVAEESNEVAGEPIDIPFLDQWLDGPKPSHFFIPRYQNETIGPTALEWTFVNNNWVLSEGLPSTIHVTQRGWAEKAELRVYDKDGKRIDMTITGKFRIDGTTYEPPSCDITGDGKVNYHDFNVWAKEYKND